MISKRMEESINEQANKEFYSAYFYLGMSNYALSTGLKGFANWFYGQWNEEIFHAKKLCDYVISRGGKVSLKEIATPPQEFFSGKDLFEKTLAHEKKVTKLINDLVQVSKEEKDKETEEFLQWFVKEQVEEEATPASIIQKISNAGKDISGVDAELLKRKIK